MAEQLMAGKKGLIMGLANDKSIAWGIAQALNEHGAQIAISYQNEMLEKRVRPLAEQLNNPLLIKCDVSDSASVEECFAELGAKWGKIDFVVHAIAFSDKDQLRGRTIDTTLDNFLNTMHISCYSFLEACRCASPIMNGDFDADLFGCRKSFAELQHYGCGKGCIGSIGALCRGGYG